MRIRRPRSLVVSLALLSSLGLVAAACGDEDDGGAIVAEGEAGADQADGGGSGSSAGNAGSGSAGGAPATDAPSTDASTLPAQDPDAPVTDDGNAGGPVNGGGGNVPIPAPGTGEARIVNPTPGLIGVIESAIAGAVLRDGNKVEARFYGGVQECYGVDRVEVEETAESVTITVFTGSPPDAAARVCIDIAELQAVLVALDAPLGERIVIDGSSGAEVPLS